MFSQLEKVMLIEYPNNLLIFYIDLQLKMYQNGTVFMCICVRLTF